MNRELALITLPAISWLLFSLGGYNWKGWRRYVLPLVFVAYTYAFGHSIHQYVLIGLWSCFVFHLGYGESTSWIWRLVVGFLFGSIGSVIALSAWQFIIPITWIVLYYLSNWEKTAKVVTWKFVEGIIGALIGVSIAVVL